MKTALVAILLLFVLFLVFRLVITPWLRKRRHLRNFQYCQSVEIPDMPEILDKTFSLPSKRRKLFSYRLNLYQLTCTCRGFKWYRGYFPRNDLRRLCRHLRSELVTVNAMNLFDEHLQRIIADRIRDKCYQRLTVEGNDIIIGFNPNRYIVRIFARRMENDDPPRGPFTGHVTKYILNVQEEVWIYGDTPPNEKAVIGAVKDILVRYQHNKGNAASDHPRLPDQTTSS
ncbi:MAG: hypothetical protein G8345_10590 [Magnetococcales bacterium]|nr:hypothetical protein [Magnetococcales bacterium]NGZ27319.1 hypothetical protein [Magnetococcales bacterium]